MNTNNQYFSTNDPEWFVKFKEKVDISNDDYVSSPEFQKLSTEVTWDFDSKTFITKAWWIEKNKIGQKRLEHIYSPYMFGITRKLKPYELKNKAWIHVLEKKSLNATNATMYYDIWKYFYRGKKGLVERLEQLGFYLSDFVDDQNKIKLLFLLYCFEKKIELYIPPFLGNSTPEDKKKKLYISSFLGNPTLENIDDSILQHQNKNGMLMLFLKCQVRRELSSQYILDVDAAFTKFHFEWDNFLKNKILRHVQSKNLQLLKNIYSNLLSFTKSFSVLSRGPKPFSRNDILEAFYLKLVQHEHIGMALDQQNICLQTCTYSLQNTALITPDYYSLHKIMPAATAKNFLKDNKLDILAFIHKGEKVSDSTAKMYDKLLEEWDQFKEMIDFNMYGNKDSINGFYLIAYIDELLILKENPKLKIQNHYYRYQTSELKSLYNELPNGRNARTKTQRALIERVSKRFFSYLNIAEEFQYAKKIEMCIDDLLIKIFSCSSLQEMLHRHDFLFEKVIEIELNSLGYQIL